MSNMELRTRVTDEKTSVVLELLEDGNPLGHIDLPAGQVERLIMLLATCRAQCTPEHPRRPDVARLAGEPVAGESTEVLKTRNFGAGHAEVAVPEVEAGPGTPPVLDISAVGDPEWMISVIAPGQARSPGQGRAPGQERSPGPEHAGAASSASPMTAVATLLLVLRHPGIGWLGFFLPPDQAMQMGTSLIEATNAVAGGRAAEGASMLH